MSGESNKYTSETEQAQKYAVSIDAEDYEWAKLYDDGDIHICLTADQADQLIEKFQRCVDTGTELSGGSEDA